MKPSRFISDPPDKRQISSPCIFASFVLVCFFLNLYIKNPYLATCIGNILVIVTVATLLLF
jgi:hypothetical protein